jgi:hypothetical protein
MEDREVYNPRETAASYESFIKAALNSVELSNPRMLAKKGNY